VAERWSLHDMTVNPVASLLIVDDEIAQTTALCRTLELEGYRTTGATSAQDALAALRQHTFDVVLTDLMMADMDGIALLRRAFAIDPNLVGIVMTGHGTVSTAVEALKAGAIDYILKPFNLSAIKPVLARAVTLRQLRVENRQLRETVGMYELSMAIAFALDSDTILREMAGAAYRESHGGQVSILRTTGDAQPFEVAAAHGGDATARVGTRMAIEPMLPVAAWVERSRGMLSRVDDVPDIGTAFASPVREIPTGIALPMLSGGRLVGMLCVTQGDAHRPITRGQIKALNVLASTGAAALERQHLEEQLRQSQKMEVIGRLTAGVAHDFNNLLTVINGYAELTLAESDAPHVREMLGEVKLAGEKAAALTQQLLAFGRKQVVQPTVLNLNTVVEHYSGILRRIIGEDIHFVTRLEPALGLVKADSSQIEQVLLNLAVNARDAMSDGGTLTIETRNVTAAAAGGGGGRLRERSAVSLVVSDTGCGIDDATRERMFEPFFTTKAPGRGTGLGLSVVRGIVTQSDSSIAVETAPGHGTTFTIRFPVAARAEQDTAALSQTAPPTGGTETILVVEDDATVRQFITTMLEHAGYQVVSARHGTEALEIYRRWGDGIELVATDLVMPHMSGPALVAALTPLDPDVRVLYLSGYADETLVGRGQPDPKIALLRKPFSGHDLLRSVRDALDRDS
jgi:signal transduction histidine kinase/DNA-binding response OmpR family regulator